MVRRLLTATIATAATILRAFMANLLLEKERLLRAKYRIHCIYASPLLDWLRFARKWFSRAILDRKRDSRCTVLQSYLTQQMAGDSARKRKSCEQDARRVASGDKLGYCPDE